MAASLRARRPVVWRGKRVECLLQRQRKDGTTVYEFSAFRRQQKLEATTVEEAVKEVRELRALADAGELPKIDRRLTLERLVEQYLEHAKGRLAPRTHELYAYRLRSFVVPLLGRVRASELDVFQLRELCARMADGRIGARGGKPMSPNSARGVVTALSACLEFGCEMHGLKRNVTRDLGRRHRPSAKRRREPNYLMPADVQALLEQIGEPYRALLETLFFSGLRISEALGLRWRDVDLEAGLLDVAGQLGADAERRATKTRSSAKPAALLPAGVRVLKEHRRLQKAKGIHLVAGDALVFVSSSGAALDRRNALRAIHRVSDGAVNLHDLRHSLAAQALRAGATLPETARLLRHSSPAVTASTYAGLAPSDELVAARKLVDAGVGR